MSKPVVLNYKKQHQPTCSYSIRLLNKLEELDEINIKEKTLWDKVDNYVPLDFDLIKQAICFAKQYHDGQFRKSGEPFYSHPLEVAYIITEYNMTTNVIITSILHDVVEDSEATVGMILDIFGWRIAEMVDMLTRDRPDGTKLTVEEILNNAYEKNDKEVLLIKVIDRLHNMQTISVLSKEKQKIQVRETLYNFILLIEEFSLDKVSQIIFNICDTVVFSPKQNMTDNSASIFDTDSTLPALFYQSNLPPNKTSHPQELELEKYHSSYNT